MFGRKDKKLERLQQIGRIVGQEREGITQAELARRLGVSRSTILKDLAIIEEHTAVLLAEDDRGRLSRLR